MLSDHLPREQRVIEPEEYWTGLQCIGKEQRGYWILEYLPGSQGSHLFAPKYIDPNNESRKAIIAGLPPWRPLQHRTLNARVHVFA